MSSTKSSIVGFLIVAYLVISPIVMGYLVYENYNKGNKVIQLEATIRAEKDLKEVDAALVDFDKATKNSVREKK